MNIVSWVARWLFENSGYTRYVPKKNVEVWWIHRIDVPPNVYVEVSHVS
jgi:hypothetical protein